MTFDDDFVQVTFQSGEKKMLGCKTHGLTWPPPDMLIIGGFSFTRVSISIITDEQRQQMTHVMRGAAYEPTDSAAALMAMLNDYSKPLEKH